MCKCLDNYCNCKFILNVIKLRKTHVIINVWTLFHRIRDQSMLFVHNKFIVFVPSFENSLKKRCAIENVVNMLR